MTEVSSFKAGPCGIKTKHDAHKGKRKDGTAWSCDGTTITVHAIVSLMELASAAPEPTCEHEGETGPHETVIQTESGRPTRSGWCPGPAPGSDSAFEEWAAAKGFEPGTLAFANACRGWNGHRDALRSARPVVAEPPRAIQVGDRVRSKTSCEGEGTVTEFFKASGDRGTSDALMVHWDIGMRSGIAVASVDVLPPVVAESALAATPAFIEALANPPEPNAKLRAAFARHEREVESRPSRPVVAAVSPTREQIESLRKPLPQSYSAAFENVWNAAIDAALALYAQATEPERRCGKICDCPPEGCDHATDPPRLVRLTACGKCNDTAKYIGDGPQFCLTCDGPGEFEKHYGYAQATEKP